MIKTLTKKYGYEFSMMGTVISVTLFEKNRPAVDSVYQYLTEMNQIFSVNDSETVLSEVNRNAGKNPVRVPKVCFELVNRALEATRRYPDSFNVLIGPLVKLWKIGFGGHSIPSQSEISQRLALVNPDRVILDSGKQTIFLEDKGMQLDLGAIAKGYFADQIVLQLQTQGLSAGIVNLGGNVKTFGTPPTSADWHLGVRTQAVRSGEQLIKIQTTAKTMVTSGVLERAIKINGHIYHHILSPQTGYPIKNDLVQITILTTCSELAEVLSTVAFFKGSTEAQRFIEAYPDVEAIMVTKNHQIVTTNGVKKMSKGVYAYE